MASKHVLIVDEDPQAASELVALLSRAGFQVDSVADCADARAVFAESDVDLVTLSLDSPVDALRAVASDASDCGAVVLCCGTELSPQVARTAMNLGARDFLQRPWVDAPDRVDAALGFSRHRSDAEQELSSLRAQHAALERRFLEQILAFEESHESFYLDLSRMMTIISNIMDGIVFADCDANITLMNPVAEDLLGIKSFMALGRSFDELPGGGDLVEALREDLVSLSTRREVNRTIEVHHSEQDLLYIKVHTSRVTDYRGCSAGVLCVMQDVTAEYKTDQLKNQYLSIVAHELRTPLTGIKTFSTMMSKGSLGPLAENQQRVVDSIREQSLRLEHQIDKLINLGHLDSEDYYGQDLERFEVGDLVQQAAAPFEAAASDRKITLTVRQECNDCELEGDRSDLRRAIQAIVENAIKFTPDGSEVLVEVCRQPAGVCFSVRDSGPGIDPRYQRRIFEKFFQVEDPLTRHHGGAGLGLFFAQGIVESHGSTLQVESQLGGGAHFSFVLPYADEVAEEEVATHSGSATTESR